MNAPDHAAVQPSAHQIQFSLLRLTNWPDIPQLAPEDMVDTARICALLSWRATAGVIIARILDLPKERVQEILLLLHAQGCLNLQAPPGAPPAAHPPAQAANDSTPAELAEPPQNSFITKIWQRLAARN